MADIVICGGGICGLGAAMMLARDGNDVTVIERDDNAPPTDVREAAESWTRSGVSQFNQAHYVHPRFRHVLEAELPDVIDRLLEGGGRRYDTLTAFFPPFIEDKTPREGDDRYWTVTGRRPMLESVFSQAAEDERGVKIIRGARITDFVFGASATDGVPHVVGVKTADGATLRADVVIDAMGRTSKLPDFVENAGGRRPYEDAFDVGYTYYGRFYRGELPQQIGPALADHGSISCLTVPADNDTWVVVLFLASGDQPLKAMRQNDVWERVVRSLPFKAHWLNGEPLGDVESMSGVMDRSRRVVVDGTPVVTGVLPLADAWACTNPSLGRGISLGMWHAQLLRGLLRSANGDPAAVTREWDAITESTLKPWYDFQVNMDRNRVATMLAIRDGKEPPAAPADDVAAQVLPAFFTALAYDADVFRAFLEVMGCLTTPEQLFARPGFLEKVIAASADKEPFAPPGPNREELLALLG